MKPSIIITIIFLSLVSIAHLLRLIFKVNVMAGTIEIPLSASLIACIITAALAIWLWQENKK
jgi:predicted PilT family ATPase